MADMGFLKVKYGGIPAWALILVAVAALLILNSWKKNKSASSQSQQNVPAQATLTAPPVTLIQEGFSGPPNNQSDTIPQMGSTYSGYIGTAYTIQPGDTLNSIMQQYYGKSGNNNLTARILTDQNPGIVWNGNGWNLPAPGTTIYLTPNGIAGYQGNTLSRYDPGHSIGAIANPLIR